MSRVCMRILRSEPKATAPIVLCGDVQRELKSSLDVQGVGVVYPTTAAMSAFAAAAARATSAFASTSGLESCIASASVRPSFSTRCLSTMNGTLVLWAAWATVANSSALLNPSAAISIRAPGFSTGFNLTSSRGSDAGSAGVVTVLGVTVLATAAFRFVAGALARGALAGVGVTPGAVAGVATVSAGCAAAPLFPSDNFSLTDGPTATPRANTPMNAAVKADALPTVIAHLLIIETVFHNRFSSGISARRV